MAVMNVDGWEEMVFIGINAAISLWQNVLHLFLGFVLMHCLSLSIRVSNELGLGHPRATKYSVYITVFQSLLIGILCMIIVLAVKNHLAIFFTNSKDLQQAVADLAWLLGITMLLNSVQPVISGVTIGGGWQGLVAYINLGSYYVFGIPLGYLLGYVADYGVVGLWAGMIAGLALQTLLLSFVLYRIDWNKERVNFLFLLFSLKKVADEAKLVALILLQIVFRLSNRQSAYASGEVKTLKLRK
uniref:Protein DETOXIFICATION n=1 Tax=Solanum lycopersicum TaxID=4081 RepID=A0A3Q7FEJ4_SOLLC